MLKLVKAQRAEIEFLTASEVYDRFISTDWQPPGEFGIDSAALNAQHPQAPVAPGKAPLASGAAAIAATLPNEIEHSSSPDEAPVSSGVNKPLTVEEARNLFDSTVADFMRLRVDRRGEVESGVGKYYAFRLARNRLSAIYDAEIAALLEKLPSFDEYHEAGSRVGVLPMLLARTGRHTVRIESDSRRYAASHAIHEYLLTNNYQLAAEAELVQGSFPAAISSRDVSQDSSCRNRFPRTRNGFARRCLFGIAARR